MKPFHISHKFEEKDGGKENCLTENFSSHSPSTSNNVLVGGLLKTINLDKFEGDKECGKLKTDSFLTHTLDH